MTAIKENENEKRGEYEIKEVVSIKIYFTNKNKIKKQTNK